MPLRNTTDTSPRHIQNRVDSFMAHLDKSPLALQYQGTPFVLAGDHVRTIIGSVLYDPAAGFQTLAYGLAQAIAGNSTLPVAAFVETGNFPSLSEGCAIDTVSQGDEASLAVLCGDGDDVTSKDLAWWRLYVDGQVSTSRILAPYWSTIRFGCSSWRFRANWRFTGPFTTPPANATDVDRVPATPLLFMSNRLDPVSPLRSARAMAALHPGSAFVIQNAIGHTVVGMDPSECVSNILATYFESGAVPADTAYCEPKCGPWDVGCRNSSGSTRRSVASSVEETVRLSFPLGLSEQH